MSERDQQSPAQTSNLRLNGVSRAADDGEPFSRQVVELHFNREPTDAELRALHVYMRYFSDDSSAPETSEVQPHCLTCSCGRGRTELPPGMTNGDRDFLTDDEVDSALRDAARYRFLRQPGNAIVYAKDRNAWGEGASGHIRYQTAEQLDAAVDAAKAVAPPEASIVKAFANSPRRICQDLPTLVAHNNAAVELAHQRLIRINELEAEIATKAAVVTFVCDCDRPSAIDCGRGAMHEVCKCACHPENEGTNS